MGVISKMKRFRYFILTCGIITSFGLAVVPIGVGAANTPVDDACKLNPTSALCRENPSDFKKVISAIVDTMLYVLGAVAVIVIIIAGILYTTAGGDPALITKAKNTLLYTVVGLVVAISAYAIVKFVLDRFQ